MTTGPVSIGQLTRLIERSAGARILVVGDLMLDEYLTGDVERTSPEAPVPVLHVRHHSMNLGGAANVARQLVVFGAHVELVGRIGADGAGRRLLDLCRSAQIDAARIVTDELVPTTRKQRAVTGGRQILRIDWEEVVPVAANVVRDQLAGLAEASRPDAVVLSDYAKGFLTPELVAGIIEQADRWRVPVLVDPKVPDLGRYRGASVLKANRREFEAAIGRRLGDEPETEVVDPARMLQKEAEIEQVVVTLGERGMVVVDAAGGCEVLSQSVEEVFDVSGAGDTVIAVLTLALVAGESLSVAARIANEAAGVVVGKTGVAVCEPGDLLRRMHADAHPAVMSADAVVEQVAAWRAQGRRIVFTNGCFDLLHAGHLHLLRQAAAQGDVLVVGLNSDRSVKGLKGERRPFIAQRERAAMLADVTCVDAVVVFDAADPLELISLVLPDVLVKGADHAVADIIGRDVVERAGGVVMTVDLLPGWSTTTVLERMQHPDAP